MNFLDRIEGLGHDELPRKGDEIKKPVRLTLPEFWAIEKTNGVSGWGSVQNNPCNIYYAKDGRRIEEYNATGLPSVFIEGSMKNERKQH